MAFAAPILDGIYEIRFRGLNDLDEDGGEGLAMLRLGTVLGSDRFGSLITGKFELDEQSIGRFRLTIVVAPESTLVTGFSAGPRGASVDIVGAIDKVAQHFNAVVDVAGEPVEVELRYLAPLPN